MEPAKKKILFVITKSNWGGAQRYVFDLATNLPRERFNITVAAGGNGHLISKLNEADVATIAIPHLERDIDPLKEILSLWSLFKIFRKERPDVVHLNSSKIGGLGAIAAWLAGTPKIIFTAHGWAFNEDRPQWRRSLIIFLSRFAAQFQHRIINISKRDFSTTLAYRIASPKKTVLMPLGMRAPAFFPKDKAREFLSQKVGQKIRHDSTLIGTIAELTKNKGLAHLLDAIHNVKLQATNYKLQAIIIGEGEEREKLQQQIQQLGLEGTVYLAGFIPDAAHYLKAFDVFVLPSLKEGLPYTLLEARLAGIPAAASDVGGIPDIVEHQKSGFLVPPKDPVALAEAITKIIDNPAMIKTKPRPSLKEMVERTVALYDDKS